MSVSSVYLLQTYHEILASTMNLTRYQNDEIGFHFERYDIFIIKRIQTEIYRVQSDRVSAGVEAVPLNFFLCLHI